MAAKGNVERQIKNQLFAMDTETGSPRCDVATCYFFGSLGPAEALFCELHPRFSRQRAIAERVRECAARQRPRRTEEGLEDRQHLAPDWHGPPEDDRGRALEEEGVGAGRHARRAGSHGCAVAAAPSA